MTTSEPQGDGLEALKWIIDNSCFYGGVTARAKSELARAKDALSAMGPGPCGKHPIACYSAGTTELEFIDGILIAEVAGELPYCRICTLEADRDRLREALTENVKRLKEVAWDEEGYVINPDVDEIADAMQSALDAAKG